MAKIYNKEKLDLSFFSNRNTITVAKKLIGTILVHESKNGITAGKIVETEAYLSTNDPACHAAKGKTQRNEAMFCRAGIAYVYLIYGSYYCFNVVTNKEDIGEAVLIRALEPVEGIELMKERRTPKEKLEELTSGPGKLCIAMGITREHDKADLTDSHLYLARGTYINEDKISSSTRIGISKGKEKLWRFYLKNNKFVSR